MNVQRSEQEVWMTTSRPLALKEGSELSIGGTLLQITSISKDTGEFIVLKDNKDFISSSEGMYRVDCIEDGLCVSNDSYVYIISRPNSISNLTSIAVKTKYLSF